MSNTKPTASEILDKHKPYGRNWSDFLLPDQMSFLLSAMEEYRSITKVSEAFPSDTQMINFIQSLVKRRNGFCEVYFSGLRQPGQEAEAIQFETNPQCIPTLNKPTLREAIAEAMLVAIFGE